MKNTDTDYTGRVGPLDPLHGVDWPMYSFDRPAFCFWNGFANGLRRDGWTEDQIKNTLQSKDVRWMLDGYDQEIDDFGEKFAARLIAEKMIE